MRRKELCDMIKKNAQKISEHNVLVLFLSLRGESWQLVTSLGLISSL